MQIFLWSKPKLLISFGFRGLQNQHKSLIMVKGIMFPRVILFQTVFCFLHKLELIHFLLWFFVFQFFFSLDSQKRRKRSSSLVVSKKKRKLLPFNPTEDPLRRMEQMASLATALTATRTEFSNELTYIPSMAPKSANRAVLEHGGMQVSDLIRKYSSSSEFLVGIKLRVRKYFQ